MFLNTGTGAGDFSPEHRFPQRVLAVTPADTDRDGNVDLVVANQYGDSLGVSVLRNGCVKCLCIRKPTSIYAEPQSQTIQTGQSTTVSLQVGIALNYQWYRGSSGNISNPVGAERSSFTTSSLTARTGWWARPTSDCTESDSTTATISVANAHRHLRPSP